MQSPSRKLSLPPSAAAARALSSAGPVSAEEMASRRARIAAAVASAMGDSKTAERSSERSSVYGRRGREYGAGSDFEQGRGRGRGQGRGYGQGQGRGQGFGQGRGAGRFDEREQGAVARPWGQANERGSGSRAEGGARSERRSSSSHDRAVIDVHQVFDSSVPVGQMVSLPVVELSDKGAMVDAAELGHLFIPRSQLPAEVHLGDALRVFIYQHSGRFLATAKRPYFELGMTGRLKVTAIDHETVYLDMGIPKELVLPRSEQRRQFRVGDDALVLIAIDDKGRLYASQCFNRFIRDRAQPHEFTPQQKVKLVAVAHTPLGYRVIVDDSVYGLIYSSEQHGEIQIGKRYEGYVTTVRPDGRLDVSLQISGRQGVEQAAEDILQALYYSHGHLHFNDKSDPQEIEDYLHMSKGRFKKAIGFLYKEKLIIINDDGIDLTDQGRDYLQARLSADATGDSTGSGAASESAEDSGSKPKIVAEIDETASSRVFSEAAQAAEE